MKTLKEILAERKRAQEQMQAHENNTDNQVAVAQAADVVLEWVQDDEWSVFGF